MSGFKTILVVTPLADGRHWKVRQDFIYITLDGHTIAVPAGFITDFASIPRAFWAIMPPASGKYNRAAVIHDFLYERQYRRKLADQTFLEIMKHCGVCWLARYTMYKAVRLFGWWAYNNKRG